MADKKQKKQKTAEGGELRTLSSDLKRLESKQQKAAGAETEPSKEESGGLKGNIIEDEEEESAGKQRQDSEEVKVSDKQQKGKSKTETQEDDPLSSLKAKNKQKKKKDTEKNDLSLLDETEIEESSLGEEEDASSEKKQPAPQSDEDPLADLESQLENDDSGKKKQSSSQSGKGKQTGVTFKDEEESSFFTSAWFIVTVIIILLLAIGGGVYFYLTNTGDQSSPSPEEQPPPEEEPSNNGSSEEPSEDVSTTDIIETGDSIQVSAQNSLRQEILNSVSDKSASWIEVVPTSDGSRASLSQVASQMNVTIYSDIQSNAQTYQLLTYNQNGVYKLGMIIQVSSEDAQQWVKDWSGNISFDLSKFALETSSRTVVDPQIKTRSLSVNGKTVSNYYYNYTDTFNSIDVTGISDMVVLSTSKQMQEALVENVAQ